MGWPYQQKPPSGWPLDYDSGLADFVGAWFFLEGSGTKVSDLSGNGNTGTLTGTAPAWTAGQFGPAVSLPGTDEHIDIGAIGEVKTLVYWIKGSAAVNQVASFGNGSIYNNGFLLPVGNKTVKTYVDNVLIAQATGAEKMTNGQFDANILGYTYRNCIGTVWINGVSGDGTTGYLDFHTESNGSYGRFTQQAGALVASTTYLMSCWYKTSGLTGNMIPYATSNEATLANLRYADLQCTPSASWKKITFALRTSAGSHPSIGFLRPGDIGFGSFYCDGITCKVMSSAITANVWHCVVNTIDEGIDFSDLQIGERDTGYFTGSFDHIMAFNRVLSASERALLHREPFCMFKDPAELLLNYPWSAAAGILPQITSAYMKVSA